MPDGEIVTRAIQNAIGVESKPRWFEVEKGAIRRFADATDDQNPLWQDESYARQAGARGIIAPPTFVGAMGDTEWFEEMLNLDCPLKRLVNGGTEVELFDAIHAGDTICVRSKMISARERPGKTGRMLFMFFEQTYTNQFDNVVAKVRTTAIRY